MLAALCLASLSAPDARGQSYPERPIWMVVGFAASGPIDVIARFVAQDMKTSLGQPVVIESRPGTNSLVATEAIARAVPQGHTILMATLSLDVNPIMMGKARYETLRDFALIGPAAMLPLITVTSAGPPSTRCGPCWRRGGLRPSCGNRRIETAEADRLAAAALNLMVQATRPSSARKRVRHSYRTEAVSRAQASVSCERDHSACLGVGRER